MKILVLSFYYPPDLCAGSFRASAFVESLCEKINEKDSIEVVTTLPNRYHSYDVSDVPEVSIHKNVRVTRVKIPIHKSGIYDQSKSFAVFFYNAIKLTKSKQFDAVFATSSRLFTAFLGMIISRSKNIPLYLDIRDIFLDTLHSVFAKSSKKKILPVIKWIEQITMNHAHKINLVSEGFGQYFHEWYPKKPLSFYSNGIDQEFLEFDFKLLNQNEKPVVTYAGNIGEGQGLEKIIPIMAQACPGMQFVVIGDGGTKAALIKALINVQNVQVFSPMPRSELLKMYKKSDFLFLHLNNYPAFKKVLPSKIFEYGATGKPIIAGVAGYAKEFLEEHLPDSIVFEPGNVNDFLNRLSGNIPLSSGTRKKFLDKFSRAEIMDHLTNDFLRTVQ